ncbi:MAG: hypothetical protein OXH86_10345 [Acidimicrobiaceae bacterium]|uniref:hypothetical protein n=1 Tax=Candidatus Poriferisodalis multihospitum TaxID=2983191 RepID=UPI002397068D|nr:hypothetical protein [Candidatus Poriferisodalis multihospitum]MDE0135869.1 hypothetical protein [Acidimicrobiaceae bacterium]MDE0318848.1 hypothetical protein [Acidimicrobiaceae bacterium]MDE0497743.1 hypothetical protein [Acidimicrobiaceae bacterium]
MSASDDEAAQTQIGRADDVRSLMGCLPGEPSLAGALLAEREADREREDRRFDELTELRVRRR